MNQLNIIITGFLFNCTQQQNKVDLMRAKKASSIQMATENVELMHEFSSEHLRMGIVRLK